MGDWDREGDGAGDGRCCKEVGVGVGFKTLDGTKEGIMEGSLIGYVGVRDAIVGEDDGL